MSPFVFERRGRATGTIAALAAIYAALLAALLKLDAAPWLMALLALPTLPALLDVLRNPSAGMRLDDEGFEWHSGRREGHVARGEIGLLRLDRRWDFSVRAVLVLTVGRRIHLPQESMPPHEILEAEATERGIRVERHPFSPL